MDDGPVIGLIRRQHGLITRQQALGAGMRRHQVDYRLRSGWWLRVHAGIYRRADWSTTWKSRVMGHCLAFDAVASHRTAAVLHGIADFRAGRVETTVEHGRWHRQVDAIVHQSTQIERIDLTIIDGVPTTGLARTVLDVAAVVGRRRLDATIDDVIRRKLLTYGDLVAVLDRHARRGRDGCGKLREVLDERVGEPTVPLSQWSRDVADLLISVGDLPRPQLEHRVSTSGGRFIAQLDLAYPEARLGIELDSVRYHLNREAFERDPERRNRLEVEGWTILNFTWRFFRERPEDLCNLVRAAHGKAAARRELDQAA